MKIQDTTKLSTNRFLNLFSRAWENRGTSGLWTFASRDDPPNSGKTRIVLVFAKYHKIMSGESYIAIREFRVPVGNHIISLPAGIVDEEETYEEAAARELREETGLDLLAVTGVSPLLYSSPGMTDESFRIIYANVEGDINTDGNEGSEDIEVLKWHSRDVVAALQDETLEWDAKAWMAFHSIFGEKAAKIE